MVVARSNPGYSSDMQGKIISSISRDSLVTPGSDEGITHELPLFD